MRALRSAGTLTTFLLTTLLAARAGATPTPTATPTCAPTIVASPVQDTFMREDAPNTIPGGGNSWRTKIRSRAGRRWRGLVQFDLTMVPEGSTVCSATLRLREVGAAQDAPKTHDVFVVDVPWTQNATKWSNQPAIAGSASASTTVATGNSDRTWPVTGDVQDWVDTPASNHGWMIIDEAEGDSDDDIVKYVAKESRNNTTRKPKLEILFAPPPCTVNADCADSNPCTVNERCQGGRCVVDPRNCEESPTPDLCTEDVCDPGQPSGQECLHFSACDDGFACTVDSCNPVNGNCTNTATNSLCTAGGCQVATCVADPDDTTLDEAGCKVTSAAPSGTPCAADSNECTNDECLSTCDSGANAGAACTVNSQCPGGLCLGACTHPNSTFGTPCSADGNPCTDDVCNGSGSCHVNNAAPCSDGLFCNGTDQCSGGGCNTHTGDPCTGGPECADTCNEAADDCFDTPGTPCSADGNPCTDDVCNGSGSCHVNNTAPCSDGLFCNGADTCSGGSCGSHAGDPCAGGSECANTCNEGADNCLNPSGSPCATDDGNVCTDTLCDGAGTCGLNNSAPCNDLLFCNGTDTCGGGSCSVHSGDPCTGGPDCADTCNEATDDCLDLAGTPCVSDGNPCTDDVCDGIGVCGVNNTDPCDDGNACTLADQCLGGFCQGNPMTCGDGIVQASCSEECDAMGATDQNCTPQCQFVCDPTPQAGCRQPLVSGKAFLLLKNKTPDKRDALTWKWVKGAATTLANFADPVTTNGYAICLYDGSVRPQPILFSIAPAGGTCDGKPCWKSTKGGYKYKDKILDPDGVLSMLFKEGADSKAKAIVKGKGVLLGMPTLPLTTPVTMQLHKLGDPSLCWDATYNSPEKNLSDQFKSVGD